MTRGQGTGPGGLAMWGSDEYELIEQTNFMYQESSQNSTEPLWEYSGAYWNLNSNWTPTASSSLVITGSLDFDYSTDLVTTTLDFPYSQTQGLILDSTITYDGTFYEDSYTYSVVTYNLDIVSQNNSSLSGSSDQQIVGIDIDIDTIDDQVT